MKELTRLRGYTDQMVEDANAVILTFGSYRLGVNCFFLYISGALNDLLLYKHIEFMKNNCTNPHVSLLFMGLYFSRVKVLYRT